ncbi:MAG: hypothetical protein IJ558_02690 [Treponema sp.]|nr:hypothetical protein [Treponema sp.]
MGFIANPSISQSTKDKPLEQFEVIDLKAKNFLEELQSAWEEFIFSFHSNFEESFYTSSLSRFPRNTCETLRKQNEFAEFIDTSPKLHEGMSWDEIKLFFNNTLFENTRK